MTGPSSPRCPRCEAANPAGQAFCGSCGLALGPGPAPSPSSPAPAKPPSGLRPRYIYAIAIVYATAIVTVVALLAVSQSGRLSQSSGSPAVAPTGLPAALTPAPTATPTPPTPLAAATPTPSATPAPTPTVKQLAAAYLKAATAMNTARDKAWATWHKSAQTLTHAKRLARADAAAELAFIRAVQTIPWYGDYKTLARRVLTPHNQAYVYYRSAMTSKTRLEWNDNMAEADNASVKASAAANELRIALGLPPVPMK